MADFRLPIHQQPMRKPVPTHHGFPYQPYDAPPQAQRLPTRPAGPPVAVSAHNRTRTSSSHVLPYVGDSQYSNAAAMPTHPQYQYQQAAPYPSQYGSSRRLSSATTSTSSTGNNYTTQIMSTASSADIRRSSSSRSGSAQLGYVSLMRRQKATVWCDRAQAEDARLRAQKIADKKRAYLEVHGAASAGAGRSGTLGSGKLKHSGKGITDFSPSTLVGATVPVRLSANEVDDPEEDTLSENGIYHRRTSSGRSSLGSNHRYPSGYQRPTGNANTPPNEKTDLPEVSEHPSAENPETKERNSMPKEGAVEPTLPASGNNGVELEESFGTVGDMAAPSAAVSAAQKAKTADELRRRGSVDDRTMTMSSVRLFVANPDLSD